MDSDDPNPYLQQHKDNTLKAWHLDAKGEPAFTKSLPFKRPKNEDFN